jgi:hypothetical protein
MSAVSAQKPLLIYMTGEYIDANSPSGADGAAYLQKPFRIADVLAILREAFVVANPGP